MLSPRKSLSSQCYAAAVMNVLEPTTKAVISQTSTASSWGEIIKTRHKTRLLSQGAIKVI